jgi:hypothetical protein
VRVTPSMLMLSDLAGLAEHMTNNRAATRGRFTLMLVTGIVVLFEADRQDVWFRFLSVMSW